MDATKEINRLNLVNSFLKAHLAELKRGVSELDEVGNTRSSEILSANQRAYDEAVEAKRALDTTKAYLEKL